jgi:hypothetical protein
MRSARQPRTGLAASLAIAAGLSGCGGGGGDGDVPIPVSNRTEYRHSVVVGVAGEQTLVHTPGTGTTAATVTAASASALLAAGTTALVAEHAEPTLPGVIVACVSGTGESTNVITGINPGVIAESAAILFDDRWQPVDASAAWAAAVASGRAWAGWENCGVKPEGLPSPSSTLTPLRGGGYSEDVYDGNPGTTFNVVRSNVSAAEVAARISAQGELTSEDPLRPLRLTLTAWRSDAGTVVFVETGVPTAQAPAAARGFIALYVPIS